MKSKNEKEKKKILSNLNERDKKLLACVGGVAVLAGGGYLVTNSYTRMAQLAEEHATISTELEGKNAKISQRKSLTKQLQTLNAKTLDQAKKYYGTTNQGEFIFLIDKLVNESGIKFKSVNYTESTELELQQEGLAATSSNGQNSNSSGTTSSSSSSETSSSSSTTSSSSGTSSSSTSSSSSSDANTATTTAANTATPGNGTTNNTNITQMTANIEFEGTYTQVLKLLELIDGNQQKIVSSELELGGKKSLSSTEENKNPDLTSGKIKLRFYQVKDVERYVTLESNVDKTPIQFANWESPFAIPTWQAGSISVTTAGGGTDATGNKGSLGAATTNTTSSANANSSTNLAPSYLEQLSTQSSRNDGLSAYYNSSTIYRFESPLKLTQSGGSNQYDVTVDNTDFLEGSGSNVVKIPATKSSTMYEMEFAAPYVSLNNKPDAISFSLSLSNQWQGKIGLIVKNASGQKIYLHVIRPNSWTGWREVSFDPENIPGFSYPMTIVGYYFETPSGESPETTMKLDNLSVNNLVVS